MAGRFDFTSPGFALTATLREIAREEEELRRQKVEEAERAERLTLAKAAESRAAAGETRAAEEQKLRTEIARANMGRQDRADAVIDIEAAGPGGILTGESATRAKARVPFMVDVRPEQMTLPAVVKGGLSALPGDPSAPLSTPETLESELAPEEVLSKGTRRQQVMKQIRDTPNMNPRDLALAMIDASGDDNIPASLATMMLPPKEDKVFYRDTRGRLHEPDGKGGRIPFTGRTLPDGARIINDEDPNAGSGGGGFTFQVPSALGTEIVDGKTGRTIRVIPNKLGAGTEKELTQANGIGQLLDRVKQRYTPENVGVFTGRLKGMKQEYWGGDKEYAAFRANLNTLANQIIQLRTGAQMSIPETVRILAENPTANLPPDTFMARLEEMDTLFKDYLSNRSRLGFGTTLSPEDIERMSRGETLTPREGTTPPPAPEQFENTDVPGVRRRRRTQ